MTDKEVTMALECCGKSPPVCHECKYKGKCNRIDCYDYLKRDALDLINRQQAEIDNYSHNIKNLTEENRQLQSHVKRLKKYDEQRDIALHSRLIATARAEAIKEFCEILEEDCLDFPCESTDSAMIVDVESYTKLDKKMVGDDS